MKWSLSTAWRPIGWPTSKYKIGTVYFHFLSMNYFIKLQENILWNGRMKNQMQIHEMVGPMDVGMGWAKKLPTSDPGWPKVEMIKDTSLPLFFIATFFLSSLCVCRIKSNVKLEENITVLHAIQCWQSIFQLHTTLIGVIIFRVYLNPNTSAQ